MNELRLNNDKSLRLKEKCLHCNYEWIRRVIPSSKCCPRCKSYKWQTKPFNS